MNIRPKKKTAEWLMLLALLVTVLTVGIIQEGVVHTLLSMLCWFLAFALVSGLIALAGRLGR